MPLITEMWAYVVTESPGEEGIPALNATTLQGHMAMPMVGADGARMKSLRRHAVAIAKDMGKPVKLVRFTGLQVVETFVPGKGESDG